jgi:hypothetical protein
MSKTAPYRIEERVTQPDGSVVVAYADDHDDRGEALGQFVWMAHRSRFGAPYGVNDEPDTDDFRPHSRRRLLLLGPSRTPRTVTEGPEL